MKTTIEHKGKTYLTDLSQPLDISIPQKRKNAPNAFYLGEPQFKTVVAGGFTGSVAQGGSCNCEDIVFNPHGSGTHTECAGHISAEKYFIDDTLETFFFLAKLVSIVPEKDVNGACINASTLQAAIGDRGLENVQAVVVRTLPNLEDKKSASYSGHNPPFFTADAIAYLSKAGIDHLLTDLPSLDREDDGQLQAHHAFFMENGKYLLHRTVTEMVYVPDNIADGLYWLNLQIAGFESDAAPSKPILYQTRLPE